MDARWFMVLQVLPVLLALFVLYWMFLRPLRKQVSKHRKLLKELKPGDAVVTESGMLGKVDALVEPDMVRLSIAPGQFVALRRSGIAETVDHENVDRAWAREE